MTKNESKRAFSGSGDKREQGQVFGVPKGISKGVWLQLRDVLINDENEQTLGEWLERLVAENNKLEEKIIGLGLEISELEQRLNAKIDEIIKGKVV